MEETNREQKQSVLTAYFTRFEWIAFAFVVIAGIFLRWGELDVRPYHHDESQHAMFGKYFFDFPEIQFYKYDPMMHAPLLYNFFRAVYTSLGNTLWSARAPIALIGTLFIFVPFLFRRYMHPTALLALVAAIALSPSMVYWSRFVIHDYFVISAMILTLYGAVIAAPQSKALFVLLGLTLQFCIKANVFVTIAIIVGYLFYEAAFRFFVSERSAENLKVFRNFLLKNLPYFLAAFGVLTIFVHSEFSRISPDDKDWSGLYAFSHNIALFIVCAFIFCAAIYLTVFLAIAVKDSLLRRTFSNIWNHKFTFIVALIFSVLVFCYIFSSGFRHNDGILDGLFYKSIPYWLHQHNIERIKGPLLFNFYMFSWYEFAFLLFFIVHIFLFYKNSGRVTKYAGLGILALAVVLGLLFLSYISPEAVNQNWKSMEELGARDIAALSDWTDRLATHFIQFFKIKDCLDAVGIVLILIHPVILTSTHLARREYALAFWGYYFTASFFAYSFLGEKVPWLSVYPLAAGFVYLALFYQDWFKKRPLVNYQNYPLTKIFKYSGLVLLSLAVFFILETLISISTAFGPQGLSKFLEVFTAEGITNVYTTIKTGVWDNLLLFILGFLFYIFYFIDRWTRMLNTVNLKVFLFVAFSIFCIRGSILTNFVYGGSETEYISQVHTTKEFHDLALRIRMEALTNIRGETFKVLADGDPVWPLTWYMVGVQDFKFSATPEERKDFDLILQTWEENPKNVPEGFEKRRVNLRGWWVPDFNQMTLKKFLNVSVNHIPWSPSGFTYVWLFINKGTVPSVPNK